MPSPKILPGQLPPLTQKEIMHRRAKARAAQEVQRVVRGNSCRKLAVDKLRRKSEQHAKGGGGQKCGGTNDFETARERGRTDTDERVNSSMDRRKKSVGSQEHHATMIQKIARAKSGRNMAEKRKKSMKNNRVNRGANSPGGDVVNPVYGKKHESKKKDEPNSNEYSQTEKKVRNRDKQEQIDKLKPVAMLIIENKDDSDTVAYKTKLNNMAQARRAKEIQEIDGEGEAKPLSITDSKKERTKDYLVILFFGSLFVGFYGFVWHLWSTNNRFFAIAIGVIAPMLFGFQLTSWRKAKKEGKQALWKW